MPKMKCKAMGKKPCSINNVAAVISQIIGKQFVVESGDNKTLDNKFAIYTFKEDVNYYILHGMAKKSKEKNQVISQIILDSKAMKPKDLAAEILNRVSSMTNSAISDDMTVLVTGIWDKIA